MSDPEDDREFLDEIKALEYVLAHEEESSSAVTVDNNGVSLDNLAVVRRANMSRGFGEVEPHPLDIEESDIRQRHSAYETNKKLIELLRETRRELVTILERCRDNKIIVNEKIRKRASNAKSSKVLICTAGMPYFKDAKHFPAPWNKDVRTKMKNSELQVAQLRYTCPWTAKDRNILWRAIRQEAASAVLENERLDKAVVARSNDDNGDKCEIVFAERSRERLAESLNLPKNFKAMIGPLGAREFDWLKIAATDFDDRHTADECRVMWLVFLHPEVNRYRWTKEEDAGLEELSKKYRAQDWDQLAEELGSQRSGYQCFIRYNSVNRTICSDESAWSNLEDARLRRCVDKFIIGHYIPWGTVARYMGGRSKSQVYYRWMYNTAPRLKKGRFTEDEDARLIQAVRKYGENFSKISSCVMTNRSSVQLSDHYSTLRAKKRGVLNSWSINEDARLLVLYNKYGADWSSIARKIIGKTRTQVRHRHKAIIRYWDKGISLYEIPRDYSIKKNSGSLNDDEAENTDLIDNLERDRIEKNRAKFSSATEPVDLELIKYFQLVPGASKPGRKRKYYDNDELEDMTRKLCIILKALGANLAVTEDLEEIALTEKDKQLINSLKDYQQLQSENAKVPTRDVRYGGIYDAERGGINGEKHFAPLCSGDCNLREKLRWHDTIDYEPPPTFDHCQVALNMKFDTPTTIVDLVGEERNLEFEKLMRIVISRKIESFRSNFGDKIDGLEPRDCLKMLETIKIKTLPRAPVISCEIVKSSDTTSSSSTVKKRGPRREKPWNSSASEGIIQRLDQPISCVEPNYYTLLGLQHIISKGKTSPESNFNEQEFTMTDEGARSIKILKNRLVQLFKYPIGLSHILRPKIYDGRSVQSNELATENVSIVENIADGCSQISSPPTKRTRL